MRHMKQAKLTKHLHTTTHTWSKPHNCMIKRPYRNIDLLMVISISLLRMNSKSGSRFISSKATSMAQKYNVSDKSHWAYRLSNVFDIVNTRRPKQNGPCVKETFSNAFSCMNIVLFDWNFTDCCPYRTRWKQLNIGLDNGLVSKMQ